MDEIFGTTNFSGIEDVGIAAKKGDLEKADHAQLEHHE